MRKESSFSISAFFSLFERMVGREYERLLALENPVSFSVDRLGEAALSAYVGNNVVKINSRTDHFGVLLGGCELPFENGARQILSICMVVVLISLNMGCCATPNDMVFRVCIWKMDFCARSICRLRSRCLSPA